MRLLYSCLLVYDSNKLFSPGSFPLHVCALWALHMIFFFPEDELHLYLLVSYHILKVPQKHVWNLLDIESHLLNFNALN